MAQPDLQTYHELTLYDRLPYELVERALEDAAVKFPEWEPRENNTEMVLIEVLATVVAEMVFAVNRVPGAVTEVLIRLFDIERDLGTAPTTTVTFNLADTLGHTIPAGTRVRLDLGGSAGVIDLLTDVQAVAAAGQTSVTVAATGSTATAAANGTPAGTPLSLESAIPYVDSVVLATAVLAGADPEDETSWRDRAVKRFSRLTSTLVLPEHFTADANEWPTVARATTLDLYDPDAGSGTPGDHPGHVTVAVIGSGGALLSAQDKTDLETDLETKTLANLDVHVIDPTVTAVDVTVDVVRKTSHTDQQVSDNITAALGAYLNPDAWDWDATVYRNELIALLDGVDGVERVVDITVPAGDVALTGVAPLADVGTVTVTVQAP